jgi:hypothetical protein
MQKQPTAYAPPHAPVQGAAIHALWMACPWSESLGEYDRRNIFVFAQLLYWKSEGADEPELARLVFGLDFYRDKARALTVVRSHLRRARWIEENHFPMLGW